MNLRLTRRTEQPLMAPSVPALVVRHLSKHYPATGITALDDVSLTVERGTFLAVTGPSGSGKSTLMQCAAGLDTATAGDVFLDGTNIGELSENGRTRLRRERIGFLFQSYNLIPALSVADNITLPLRLAGKVPDLAWLQELTEQVGLQDRLMHRPSELSGGQQQRAAVARAMITRPAIVFADEPTGALDDRSAHEVLTLLSDLVDQAGQCVVMVTHDMAAASAAHAAITMDQGSIVGPIPAQGLTPATRPPGV